MSAITVWDAHTAKTYTYITLPLEFAKTLIRMVEVSSGMFLVADASDDVAPLIHPRIRTSWFTRNLPPESDPTMGLYAGPHSPGCPAIKHRH